MLKLLYRLYERDASSEEYRGTLLLALVVIASSLGLLAALSRLPFREVYTAQGALEPGRIEVVRSEGAGEIRQNRLRLGTSFEPGEPVLALATGDGAERLYTAPCRCVLTRSELLQRAAGPVRAGELIAEFIDTGRLHVRFSVEARWRSAVVPGGKVQVLDEEGRLLLDGAVERVYPRGEAGAGLEAMASLPGAASLAPGSQVTVKVVAPPVSLWQFFMESLGRRKG